MNYNLNKLIINNSFWIYSMTFFSAIFGYLIKITYAKNLTIAEFGLFYAMFGFLGIISIFNDLGLTETLNYYGTRFYEKNQFRELKLTLYYTFIAQLTTATLISGILLYFIDFFAISYFKSTIVYEIFPPMLLFFIFANIIKPLIVIFGATFNFLYKSMFNFLSLLFIFIFSYFFILSNKITLLIISKIWFIIYFILTIFYFFLVFYKFNFIKDKSFYLDQKLIKKLFKYAKLSIIGTSVMVLISGIDIQMISYILGLKQVAYYEVALVISSILIILFSPISGLIFPLSSKLIQERKASELNKILNFTYYLILFLAIPVFITIIFYSKLLILTLFKKELFFSFKLIVFLAINSIFAIYFWINFMVLSGINKHKEKNKLIIVAGSLNIILNYIFILYFGIVGVSVSTTLVSFILFYGSLKLINKNGLKIKLNPSLLLKIFFATISFCIAIILLNRISFPNIYLNFVISSISSFSVYIIFGLILKIYSIEKISNLLNLKKFKKYKFLKKL